MLLQHARGAERFYWRDPHDAAAFAGFGVATELFAWNEGRIRDIERQARDLFCDAVLPANAPVAAYPRLMGGFAFRDDFVPDNTWSAFHPAHFILPHVQLVEYESGEAWLTLNAIVSDNDDLGDASASLREALQARLAWLRVHVVRETQRDEYRPRLGYPMSFAAWENMVEDALAAIARDDLIKVVLSRVCEFRGSNDIDVGAALSRLDTEYAGCYRFMFEPRPHHAFLGATPELLVRVRGHTLDTMALAGSQRRGRNEPEDAELEHGLLNSAKDRREHQVVLDELCQRLQSRVSVMNVVDTHVLKLGNIQHLYAPIHAQLREAEGVLPLVELLHPTPALGGLPRDAAMAFIRAVEPVTRGWYAAPIGWLDVNLDGAFCVAIRSAVTQRERAWLYAGCGIVAGSQAGKEWDESALKFKPMLNALVGESLPLEADADMGMRSK
jgi:menaquinone-specific isochorismate synthase